MRRGNLFTSLLCLVAASIFSVISAGAQEPKKQPKFETIEIGMGGTPKWSPDGTRLAFLSGGWLRVAKADGTGKIDRIAELRPWSFDWMSDSAFVISEKKEWRQETEARGYILAIETLNMKGHLETIRRDSIVVVPRSEYLTYPGTPFILPDGTAGYYEVHEKPEGETKVFEVIKKGKLGFQETGNQLHAFVEPYGWGDIWVGHVDGTSKRKVTDSERKYGSPLLSPDTTMILAHHYGVGVSVLDLQGNVIADLSKDLPQVKPGQVADIVSANWSPDSKKLLYGLTIEDGHSTYDEDIYVFNLDGTGEVPIAATPDQIETSASWSPDGTRIAYRNQSSGKIFVVRLE